jgi:hypothetical protein
MLSDLCLVKLRISPVPMYTLATEAGADPFWLSRLVSAALAVKARDERLVRLGQLVGLTAGEIFDVEGQRAGGFVMTRKGRLDAPAIFCQRCGDEITDIGMAGVVYRPSADDGHVYPITILCKARGCLSAPEYRNARFRWHTLDSYLLWLLSNLGIDSEEKLLSAWRQAEMFSGL